MLIRKHKKRNRKRNERKMDIDTNRHCYETDSENRKLEVMRTEIKRAAGCRSFCVVAPFEKRKKQ